MCRAGKPEAPVPNLLTEEKYMKRTALVFAAALMTSPVFAASDLCDVNLQKINDGMTTSSSTLGEPMKTQLSELKAEAEKAREAGDEKGCIAASGKALQMLRAPGDGGGSNGGSGQ
jgi:hypothetical protein